MRLRALQPTTATLTTAVTAIAVLVLIAIAGLTYVDWMQYRRARAHAIRNWAILQSTNVLLADILDAEAGQRGFLLTGDEHYLEPYNRATRDIPIKLDSLSAVVGQSDGESSSLARLKTLVQQKLEELHRTIGLRKQQGVAPALGIVLGGRGELIMNEIRTVCSALEGRQEAALADSRRQAGTAAQTALAVTTIGSVILLAFFVAGNLVIRRTVAARERALAEAQNARDSLTTTLRSIGDAVISTDARGCIVFANPVAQSLLGWPEADILGRRLDEVFQIVSELTRAPVESPVRKVLREGTVVGLANHTLLIARDGTEIPIDDSAAPIRNAGGTIQGTVLVFRDVTARRRSEQTCRLLTSIVESSDDAIVSEDLNGVITSWNRGAERMFGYTSGEMIGRPPFAIAVDTDELPGILERIKAGEHIENFETVRRTKSGGLLDVSISVSPLRDGLGRIAGASEILRDITLQKRMEQQLRETAEGLRVALEAGHMGVWEWNTASDTVKWSPELAAIHGLPPGGFGGRFEDHLRDTHADDRAAVAAATKACLENKTDHDIEYRIVRPDGSVRWVHAKGRVVLDANGAVAGVTGVCMDVTERKRAEERFHVAVEAAPYAMVMVDGDGRIVLVNSQTERLFGYARNELLGRPVEVLAPVRSRGMHQQYRKEYLADPQARRMGAGRELFGVRKDGSAFPVEIGLNPIQTEEGTLVLSGIVDITERRRLQQELRQLAGIVESSDDAMIGEALDGTITSWNRGAAKMYGYSADEIIGRRSWLLAPPGREQEITNNIASAGRGETIEQFQTRRRRKDGVVIDVSLTISPVRNTYGDVIGAAVVGRDITEQVRSAEHLARLNADLERSNASLARSNEDLEAFAFMASHDLQEPLRMIASYSELLARRRAGANQESDEFIAYIKLGVERMRTLITDLLEYSRVAHDESKADHAVSMEAIVGEALGNLHAAVRESGADVLAGSLPHLVVHEHQMVRVFQNLIGNAIKYRRPRSAPRIHISAIRDGDEWTFRIEDDGIGIDLAYKESIFGAFKRLHSQHEYPGSGLGLATCKRIVERHGGRIWVESTTGTGSTFFFTLPAARGEGNLAEGAFR